MYLFGKITVNPQLPERINKLSEISNNLWWSWNSEFLRLFQFIDLDLWLKVNKNPIKFLQNVSQDCLEKAAFNEDFLSKYDIISENFTNYINSKNTWFSKNYPNNKKDLIAYFSAEFGLDEIIPIYSGGLGILAGDHCKSASDLGIPFIGVGLLYKHGYFNQNITPDGSQESIYKPVNIYELPVIPVADSNGNDMVVSVDFPDRKVYLKVWKINIGRVSLYLLDSDIDLNHDNDKQITLKLYGGNQEMRIQQEIILGIGGMNVLKALNLNPTIFHMNEGHCSFVTLELIKNLMHEKDISFEIARDIASAKTAFTTHTPVPAGNDIFPISLVEKYFKNYWAELGINREEFLKLGMKADTFESTFNMGVLALKIAGKKNGVSKLHGEVSRELFSDLWTNFDGEDSPITHVTNGVHTCSWLAPNLKDLYNKYFQPYWQENIHDNSVWEAIENIPDEELWNIHQRQKEKLLNLVKNNVKEQLQEINENYELIKELENSLNPNAFTIGFGRRFATYKRATLIFKDLERITKLLNDPLKPVQLVFAGKAHPADIEGQDLIKTIHELSKMPQFKGKIFILENYNISIARYLVSGVDIWLNNPRRPMEASGTSGQKASINGVPNFSILDGWWAEGYTGTNGWAIGDDTVYSSHEDQDIADSNSIYNLLENEIIPKYYEKDFNGVSHVWARLMKNSIKTCGGNYSTSRMLVDYVKNLYIPLINVTNKYYNKSENVTKYNNWKHNLYEAWNTIEVIQNNNMSDVSINAGNSISIGCDVFLNNISPDDITVQVYYGRFTENGNLENTTIIPIELTSKDKKQNKYTYETKLNLSTGGQYGYTFRVIPKNDMLLEPHNLNLVKWLIQE